MSGDRPVANTVGRLSSTRFLAETPPRSASLRIRRGIQKPQALELSGAQRQQQLGIDKIDEEGSAPCDSINASVQESTLRKRQRIAELRRKRQESSRAALGASFFNAPDGVAADEPILQSSGMMSSPVRWPRALESPESQNFFENSDLALLLRLVEVPDIDAMLEPPKRATPSASGLRSNQMASHIPRPTRPLLSVRGNMAADFSINIPSTSLSPVLPTGWTRNGTQLLARQKQQQRRQSRNIAAQRQGDDDDDDSDGGRQPVQTRVDNAVAAQLEAEMARNQELHAELMRLHLMTRKLAKLVLTNENINRNKRLYQQ
ncbi:hypothetical protein GGI20_001131 [Coemansia sp. BCRC 34301]|nr:hypothetical protein GGI20_001131 [Coemansia sp. BCRC 34301]